MTSPTNASREPQHDAPTAQSAAPAPIRATEQHVRPVPAGGLTYGNPSERDATSDARPNAVEVLRRAGKKDGRDKFGSPEHSFGRFDVSNVRVRNSSSAPAGIGAAAYARGNDIHLGANQNQQDVPHEAWHVVQQAQGRVQAPAHHGEIEEAELEEEADAGPKRKHH